VITAPMECVWKMFPVRRLPVHTMRGWCIFRDTLKEARLLNCRD